MKLNRVQIKNYRSIKDIEINFDPPCRVLVGINESGKSNILNALALLSDDSTPSKKDDLREALSREGQIKESEVIFVFRFEKTESDKLFEVVSGLIIAGITNPDIANDGKKNINIKEFCAARNEGLYSVSIIEEKKAFYYWDLDRKYQLLDGWKKPASACPTDFQIELKGHNYQLSKYKLVRARDIENIPDGYLEDASTEDLDGLVGNAIIEITKDNLPNALYWKYDEKNLLPNSLKITEFAINSDMCVPLKNMFMLAGIDDIKGGLEEKSKLSNNQFQNYLKNIAKKTTNQFRSIWKEYKNIEFSLKLDGDKIIPGITEENTYDFARRSDGFKRFVTFLLMISLNVKIDKLHNTLILVDEADSSLHPTGARYLRDELIRISKTNYVVYSTHSIFMIDSGDISRHYIVKKKDEITTFEQAQTSNIADEEVLYNALGYSVFEILKEKNIIFEGWNDKHLFQVALKDAAANINKKYKDVGICHARGAKSIRAITPMIELAKRKCLIVSDSDLPAKEQKKKYEQEKGFGEWKHYQDIDSSIEAITGEDFLKNDFVAKQINVALSGASMPSFNQSILPNKKDKIATVKKWLRENNMSEDQVSDTIKKIKNTIFDNLKCQNIEDDYIKLLLGISLP
jgi:predicted ATP-dependent endonuclease of OLD family